MQGMVGELLCVALGAVVGGAARYFVSGFIARSVGETFPWGTLVVNVTGALVIGFAASLTAYAPVLRTPALWQVAVVGFLGSYTTVSSFSLQTLALARDGEFLRAGMNVALSVVLCLIAVALGFGAAAAIGGGGP